MAEEFVGLALDSVPTIVNKYDTIADRSKRTIKKLPIPGRKSNRGEQEYYQEGVDDYGPPRRSQTEKQRPRDSYYADDQDKKYSYNQRTYPQSAQVYSQRFHDGDGKYREERYSRGRPDGKLARQSGYHDDSSASDSETSIPPRRRRPGLVQRRSSFDTSELSRRNPNQNQRSYDERRDYDSSRRPYDPSRYVPESSVARRDNNDAVSTRKGKTATTTTTSSHSDTESLPSSSEDERKRKKLLRNELLTAGLAAVATIHAASGVYASMEASEQRHEQVRKGELTAQEARKEKNKARLQDVAAIGVAALSLKGAYSQWQTTKTTHNAHKEYKHEKEKRHRKRVERERREKGYKSS